MTPVAAVLERNNNMITPGARVLVKAGTVVYDTLIGGTRVQKVNRTVVVAHLSSRLGHNEVGKETAVPTVMWAGSGSYWNKCDAVEVELRVR